VAEDILDRVLTAAHHGPSVGHSQPWRFILVTDPAIRERAAVFADCERLRQAALLAPDAARRLLDLQLEGIREAPLGVVVCCDRRSAAAGILGRATFQDADLWSCACAIENMWLAARSEGLGMGWVTLFQPADLAALLNLPEGVETLGWLCLGWPDERPPEPGLVRAGWSHRLPLTEVIFRNTWPQVTDETSAPISHLRAPDQRSVVSVRDERDRLLTTPGSLGGLDRALNRITALRHPHPDRGVLVIAASDHPVTGHSISAYSSSVTREIVDATLAGQSVGSALAMAAGLDVVLVDAGVEFAGEESPSPGALDARPTGSRGDLVSSSALEVFDVIALIEAGRLLAAELAADYGLIALGEIGIGNTTIAAALTCGLLQLPPNEVVGLGAGSDSAMIDRKEEVVTAALARARIAYPYLSSDPLALLAEVGGPEFAFLTGVILGAAAQKAAVILDGMATAVAALIAVRLEPATQSVLIAGQRSRERGHRALLIELGLEPLSDVRIRAGEGSGAVLATSLLRTALSARTLVARVDE
jgi:nicotinate-nucleotide--dimethylbenzimidazole phosphoribosyltransferase